MRVLASAGWSGVVWSDMRPENADAVIADALAGLRARGTPYEWKWFSYDQPSDLPERLATAGLVPGAVETVLVAEVRALDLTWPDTAIQLLPVVDAGGAAELRRVHEAVFGGDHSGVEAEVLAALAQTPTLLEAVLVVVDGHVVGSGRVEFAEGTDFASLWGGGTLAACRGRGAFRASVAYRARLASDRGYRYLQVDATDASRPILERLGFRALCATRPFRSSE